MNEARCRAKLLALMLVLGLLQGCSEEAEDGSQAPRQAADEPLVVPQASEEVGKSDSEEQGEQPELAEEEELVWLDSVADAVIAGEESGQLIAVTVVAGGPRSGSRRLFDELFSDSRVVEACGELVNVCIEGVSGVALDDERLPQYGEMVFFRPDGTEAKRFIRIVEPELFLHTIRRLTDRATLDEIIEAIDPGDAELLEAAQWCFEALRKQTGLAPLIEERLAHRGRKLAPLLARRIWHEDLMTRSMCLQVLAGAPVDEVFWDLMAYFYDPDRSMRKLAIEGLGKLADRRASADLVEHALTDPDDETARHAAVALGRLGEPAAAPGLLELAARGVADKWEDALRRECLVALYLIGKGIPVAKLAGLLSAVADPRTRTLIVSVLGEMRQEEALEPLLELLARSEEAFHTRIEAVYSLRKLALSAGEPSVRPRCLEALLAQCEASNPELRATAAAELGTLRAAKAIPRLVSLLSNDGRAVVRAYACLGLGRMYLEAAPGLLRPGEKEALASARDEVRGLLVEALRDESALVRNLAVTALCKIGEASYTFLLLESLRQIADRIGPEDIRAATSAIVTLYDYDVKAAVPLLVELLNDELDHLDKTRAACIALERLTGFRPEYRPERDEPRFWVMMPPRILFSARAALSIRAEREKTMAKTGYMTEAWREWWEANGGAFNESLEEERRGDPSVVSKLDAELFNAVKQGAQAGAREFHVWLKVGFVNPEGSKLRPKGWLEVLPDQRPEAAGDAPPLLDELLTERSWPSFEHGDGWFLEAASRAPVHTWGKDYYVHIESGFAMRGEQLGPFRLRFVYNGGVIEKRIEALELGK